MLRQSHDDHSDRALVAQTLSFLREEPGMVLRYGVDTVRGAVRFARARGARGPGAGERLLLLGRFLRAHLGIPGAVTLLECIALAEEVLASDPGGLLVEVGCYRGRSTACLSWLAHARRQTLMAVDTFAGLPEASGPYPVSTDPDRSYLFQKGDYAASQETLHANLERFGIRDPVRIVVADVAGLDALPGDAGVPVSLAFLDVDLRSSYDACFRVLARRVRSGTRFVLHEGLLEPIRALVEDPAYWKTLDLPAPAVRFWESTHGFRTSVAVLEFSA